MPVVRKIGELSDQERGEIQRLIQIYYKDADQAFLNLKTMEGPDFDVVMEKQGEMLKAAVFCHIQNLKTPFFCKRTAVFHNGLALKDPAVDGSIIMELGRWYAKNKWSRNYMFKDVVGITTICNPRVYENILLRYKQVWPSLKLGGMHTKQLAFLRDYFSDRSLSIQLDEDGCSVDLHLTKMDITEDWETVYAAKNSSVNEMFEERGIIQRENGKIYRTNKMQTVIGVRSVWKNCFAADFKKR